MKPGAGLRCINCGICVDRMSRHVVLELDIRVISLFSQWISPEIITDTDFVCHSCWENAMSTINKSLQEEVTVESQIAGTSRQCPPKQIGHSRVCPICGCSLLRTKTVLIQRSNPSEVQQLTSSIILDQLEPQEVINANRVCLKCWDKSKKKAGRIINQGQVSNDEPLEITEAHQHQDPEENIQQCTFEQDLVNITNDPPSEPQPEPQSDPFSDPTTISVPSSLSEWLPPQRPHDVQEGIDQNNVTLTNYRRAANTARHCVFADCENEDLHRVSDELRSVVFCNHKYYLPEHTRVCNEHMIANSWELLFDSSNSSAIFTADYIEHAFSLQATYQNRNVDFENVFDMDDDLVHYWIGQTKDNLRVLLREVPRIQESRRGLCGLVGLLIKYRTGDSDERLATLMKVPRSTLERLMGKVREILLQDFVPRNLGINHISREQIMERNLLIPTGIYGNEHPIVIFDGTYVYIYKSANYKVQKDTFSPHKHLNLVKPFMLVACDGYIIDCFGPYNAKTSDATIMKSLFEDENSPLRQYFRNNDVFIVDRGFRDAISILEESNYRPYMPESLLEGEYQLTTEQANRTRCVTICRWVVEVVNGYFKRDFKIFRQEYFNKSLPHMMQDFQIASALLNKFAKKMQNRPDAAEILNVLNQRKYLPNNLAILVDTYNLNRRSSNFNSLTADRNNLLQFPRLEMNDLILFALGTYQIRQARSYYGEHVRFHGGCRIEVCREVPTYLDLAHLNIAQPSIIRGRIQSRYRHGKKYFVYTLIEDNMPGREAIREYCCNCIAGRRTLGSCAHVMTLVWYLGWARHRNDITAPAEFLDYVCVRGVDDDEGDDY